jgi:dTDP-4-dehydrorhamnose 3,5-epimerase-like enzyme
MESFVYSDAKGSLVAKHFPDGFLAKRTYSISTLLAGTIRAWHGHKIEEKILYFLKGSGIIAIVELDNFELPSENLVVERFLLNANENNWIYIPKGHAHGIGILTDGAEFIVQSNFAFSETPLDDYRYPPEQWDVFGAHKLSEGDNLG